MPSGLRYVDSCCVILIIDKDDTHRKDYGCGRKNGEVLFPNFCWFCVFSLRRQIVFYRILTVIFLR